MENTKEAALWQLIDAEITDNLSEVERLQMSEDAICNLLCEEEEIELSISNKLADWLIQEGYTVTRIKNTSMYKITY